MTGHRTGDLKKVFLFAECMALFFILPAGLYFIRHWFCWKITPFVAAVAGVCCVYLIADRDFDRRRLWSIQGLPGHVGGILLTFLFPAAVIGVFTYVFLKIRFLYFVAAEPVLWLVFVLFYPLLAVYPQEVVFRAFFFHRYRGLFGGRTTMIILSGLSFGLAHLFFANWFAPVLSTLGGILFAWRYSRAGSLVAVSIEHGLWGDFLFTIGLGWYFYSGSIR